MNDTFVENKLFKGIDYTINSLDKGEYDNCTFVNCIFSDSDLSMIHFIECEFDNCNLGMAKMNGVVLNDVNFTQCKPLGIDFHNCDTYLFSAKFKDCVLNLASFYKLKLNHAKFTNCILQEVDFIETNLTSSIFDNCDLSRAVFENTILEKADFRSSYNYSINPEINKIKNAKFSLSGIVGLLEKYNLEID